MMDSHVIPRTGTLEYIYKLAVDGKLGDDLHYGPCASSRIRVQQEELDGLIWSEWTPKFGRDGMMGKSFVNEAARDSNTPPYEIQHSGTGRFLCRLESFLWY